MTIPVEPGRRPLRVLFLVEGFTDIRFVAGLARTCELTLALPERCYRSSGLDRRIAESGAPLSVDPIPGGRIGFQARSLAYLLGKARRFDVILAQEVTRGALNANLAGRLRGVPVLNTLMMAPVEYYRCRRERGLIPWWHYRIGDATIRSLMRVNGRLATGWLALGPYLRGLAARRCARVGMIRYYGVDVDHFRPADPDERRAERAALGLPPGPFLALVSSRVSHEKDPETALRAVARLRATGLDAAVLNLGGGHQEFVALAHRLGLGEVERWVFGRPAAHPMGELAAYYRAVDVVIQASLAEGLGLSPLEALACGTPVVASEVGGMAEVLPGYARLFPRGDDAAAADQLAWIAAHAAESRDQALRGRDYVAREWNHALAFAELRDELERVARSGC